MKKVHSTIGNPFSASFIFQLQHVQPAKALEGAIVEKNNDREVQPSCVPNQFGSRCPCVKIGNLCSRDCRCKGCENIESGNNDTEEDPNITCRCGTSKAKGVSDYVSSTDGRRKSKCPCLRNKQGCGPSCACVNCANIYQQRPQNSHCLSTPPKKRRCTTANTFNRKNSAL